MSVWLSLRGARHRTVGSTDTALSEHTVKRHVANVLTKLDLPTRLWRHGLACREWM